MKIDVYIVSAFSEKQQGGNEAGVVLLDNNLTDLEMQGIAAKVGLSETAFVSKSNKADFNVRFFTPSNEVDLCGHATVAAFYLLYKQSYLRIGSYVQKTNAGLLEVDVSDNGLIYLQQAVPRFFGEINKSDIASALNIPLHYIAEKLPVEIVSTGLKDIVVPIKGLTQLLQMQPNIKVIEEMCKTYQVVGLHTFSRETLKPHSTAHCRNFAPLYGIREESATGTSNGALSCYLFRHQLLQRNSHYDLSIEQGHSMGKPSQINVSLKAANNQIVDVKTGGFAHILGKQSIEL
ncbi:PhzF family phenazine biosynthesis protein [Bacillus aquiflavi]|uniref:PhzF family phenazine biosynthesis protein n=1 Tax=Bacillus aquiflavi TaxID=2672567 RepID=A0A6B3VQ69_9BACI|nr:PhzF family phenazine biosynthesis protein [Bacillus aquiflavi]MBA4535723.1 PhzF family phenazine biosynthesis protein [Bacillus aquiflavi]NEY80099.1 PhzF family phenazine biosynthesis protein [Bacillus aquiflavi]UAC48006.1 PhzF family phenazine biosynthesis protein [Bacillus aquiflavi]